MIIKHRVRRPHDGMHYREMFRRFDHAEKEMRAAALKRVKVWGETHEMYYATPKQLRRYEIERSLFGAR